MVDSRGLSGHTGSVEDIQWSPSEAALLVSIHAFFLHFFHVIMRGRYGKRKVCT